MHGFSCDRMGKIQAVSAQELMLQTKVSGEAFGCFISVLRVAQNRESHMGAMEPKLMGAACNRAQLKLT